MASRREGVIAVHRGQPFELTLHIGTGKTGSTSLQTFLRQNRDRLADAGWLFPRSIGRHQHFGAWIRPERELATRFRAGRPGTRRFDTVEELYGEVPRRLVAEVRRTGLSQVLMSDEGLWQASDPSLQRLRQFANTHTSSVRLVCYLRRQDDHLVSRYQQAVKHGETRTLRDRVSQIDLAKTYDYYARLRTWLRFVDPAELIVRRFERHRMRNESLYDDFVDAVGLGIPTDDLPLARRNESLDAEAVEFLRLLNLCRAENQELDLPPNPALLDKLRALGTGPVLTLPGAELDRFMARWADSNERVARELLGEPEGLLFTTPRKSINTTTRQMFDPARLDQYLPELPELPTEVATPLRRIAEREAGTK